MGWDWASFVRSLPKSFEKELDLGAVAPGDRILVKTRNTLYLFTWKGGYQAELRTNKRKTPGGLVQIMGCSFGLSSSIRPDALFCGGNLEFTHEEGEKTWTTSKIDEIYHLHLSEKKSPCPP
jgi:hypothetical protein